MPNHDQLERQRLDILNSIGSLTRMRRGTVNEQFFMKKKSDGSIVRLGPYFLFSRTEKRQPYNKRLTHDEVERYRKETENCRRFKELVTQYILACEGLADCAADKTPAEVKITSKRSSMPKSLRRSKR